MSAAAAVDTVLSQVYDNNERQHPRVEAGFMVKVLVSGRAVLAKAKDLSMAGLYLLGAQVNDRERVTIAIPLPGDKEVTASCAVRRRHRDGVGLEFEQLDWDDLLALARYLHPRLP